jgi:hypothetical protein
MRKRPWSVTIAGWIFVLVGAADVAFHVTDVKLRGPFAYDALWPLGLGLVAIVCGLFVLRGSNWARWLAVAWLAFHVILSGHVLERWIVHTLLLAVLAYLLFRPQATAFFRASRTEGA